MKEWQVAALSTAIIVLVVTLIVTAFTLLILGADADDYTEWQPIDDRGECYIKIQHERNFVGTPGESRTTRTTYCRP